MNFIVREQLLLFDILMTFNDRYCQRSKRGSSCNRIKE